MVKVRPCLQILHIFCITVALMDCSQVCLHVVIACNCAINGHMVWVCFCFTGERWLDIVKWTMNRHRKTFLGLICQEKHWLTPNVLFFFKYNWSYPRMALFEERVPRTTQLPCDSAHVMSPELTRTCTAKWKWQLLQFLSEPARAARGGGGERWRMRRTAASLMFIVRTTRLET